LQVDDPELRAAIETHLESIAAEALAVETELSAAPADAARLDFTIATRGVTAALIRADG
jgi:hypothetical protein